MDVEARFFKALSDPTRLRIAAILASEGEVCVCRLAGALAVRDFRISRHLAVLRAAGIVAARREGTWVYYKLAAPRSALERSLYAAFRRHLGGHPVVRADIQRLRLAGCTAG